MVSPDEQAGGLAEGPPSAPSPGPRSRHWALPATPRITSAQAEELLKAARDSRQAQRLSPKETIEHRILKVRADNEEQNLKLRKVLAYGAFIGVAIQLLISNLCFIVYGWATGWSEVDPNVMIAWLGAAVLECVGIVAVIAKHLFPDSA